jgi:hypothetical protein
MPHQRHAKHQRLLYQLLEPALVTEPRCCEATVEESPRTTIDQGFHSELLGEPLQLAGGGGALLKIDEMSLYPALGKESKRFPGLGALSYTEDLDFHGAEL